MENSFAEIQKTIETANYFAELLSKFDGENAVERSRNSVMAYKAVRKPDLLTPQDIFKISFLLERMQSTGFGDVQKLEDIRLRILTGLENTMIVECE